MLCLHRFKNVIFEITPTEEVGDFEVKAKFMGVQMETFMLHYQVGVRQGELAARRPGWSCSRPGWRRGRQEAHSEEAVPGGELGSHCGRGAESACRVMWSVRSGMWDPQKDVP